MAKRKSSFGGWVIAGLLAIVVFQCSKSADQSNSSTAARPPPTTAVTRSAPAPRPAPIATVPTNTPAAIEIRYITASSLNIRANPNSQGSIVGRIAKGQRLTILERSGGWVRIQSPSGSGWVSEQYTSTTKPQTIYVPPAPLIQAVPKSSGLSCSPRRTCSQIPSCSAARWYLANCSWGGRLDRDNDGRPCESMC